MARAVPRSRLTGRKNAKMHSTVCTEGAKRPKIMAIAIHPYLSGQPSRIKYLEAIYEYTAKFKAVLYWNGEQILDWYLKPR